MKTSTEFADEEEAEMLALVPDFRAQMAVPGATRGKVIQFATAKKELRELRAETADFNTGAATLRAETAHMKSKIAILNQEIAAHENRVATGVAQGDPYFVALKAARDETAKLSTEILRLKTENVRNTELLNLLGGFAGVRGVAMDGRNQ